MSEVQAEAAAQGVLSDSADQAEVILRSAEGILAKGDVKFISALIMSHGFMLSLLDLAEEGVVTDYDFRKKFIEAFKPVAQYLDGMLDERLAQI